MTDGLRKANAWVGIVAGVLGAAAVLVVPVGLLYSMNNKVEALSVEMVGLRADVRDLREQRFTRGDQLQWVRDEFAPLEARVRALEVAP